MSSRANMPFSERQRPFQAAGGRIRRRRVARAAGEGAGAVAGAVAGAAGGVIRRRRVARRPRCPLAGAAGAAGAVGGVVRKSAMVAMAQVGLQPRKAVGALKRLGYSVHVKSAAKAANARRNPWIQFMRSMKGVSRPAGLSQREWMGQLSAEYRSRR